MHTAPHCATYQSCACPRHSAEARAASKGAAQSRSHGGRGAVQDRGGREGGHRDAHPVPVDHGRMRPRHVLRRRVVAGLRQSALPVLHARARGGGGAGGGGR
eukprot:9111056-Alexandrium_andersonii.AAC.1